MDGATPSWLDGDASSTPAPAEEPTPALAPAPVAADNSAPAGRSAPQQDNVAGSILAGISKKNETPPVAAAPANDAADEADLPKIILLMRVMNMAAATLLITASIITLTTLPHISVWVTAIYASCGGLLVCCLETQLKFARSIIAMNFGFLFHSLYRFLFYCLMASVSWMYPSVLGRITAIVFGVVAVFNTYVLCRYPAYRRMREKIAEEEDKRIQAKINQQVRKQAINNMGWGK